MDNYVQKQLRVIFILSGIIVVLLIASTIAVELHQPVIGGVLGALGVAFAIPMFILSKIGNKKSKVRIDKISQMMDRLEMVPAQKENISWLDNDKLYKWTSDLEKQGFVNLGDYTLDTGDIVVDGLNLSKSFIRVTANEKYKCFAEIGQSYKRDGLQNMVCTISTLYLSGDRFITSNNTKAQPDIAKESYPKLVKDYHVNLSQHPGASPEELVKFHIEERDRLVSEKGLVILEDVSMETYRQQARLHTDKIRKHISQDIMMGEVD